MDEQRVAVQQLIRVDPAGVRIPRALVGVFVLVLIDGFDRD
jgi:hypothetical protein